MGSDLKTTPTRRAVLGAGGVAATVVVGGDAVAAPGGVALDLTSDEIRLRAYMLMRGALDDRLVIGFVAGRYYGVVDDEIRPLFGVHGATFSRYRMRSDGGYDGAGYEVAFFTDLDTGVVLETWANPYTGKTVTVPKNTTFPPGKFVIGQDLRTILPPRPGLVSNDKIWPAKRSGDEVWLTQDTRTAFTPPGAAKPFRYSELITYHARASDLARAGVARVATQTAWTAVVSWRPWLSMADHPGHLWGNASGRFVDKVDDLPASWLAGAAHYRPQVLKDPGGPLTSI